ncbi:MAG: rhodanese-like domain-containing protein [Deltaproteobacteria bacterium]|nr:rhodanese-like domain-containing protein [Deltaproteobacteria bacterium]
MGPFVPDIITNELNLIVAFFIGIGFGFVLEQAGFSSSRKLTGLFYGTDFTVLRVFFAAGVTALTGILLLAEFGLLDTSIIYINPTYLYPAIVGGGIMGVGFVVGGYCPGTSFCAAAIGKIDAMVFVLGGLLGVLLFSESFSVVGVFYESGFLGDPTMDFVLGISKGQFALLLIVVAVAAFIVTTMIEQKVNASAPSKDFPYRYHRIAALGVLSLGLVLAALPEREARLLAKASDEVYQNDNPVKRMTADELAFRILDSDPSLQSIDVRGTEEFSEMSLPGAVNIPMQSLFGKEWRDVLAQSGTKKVFFADNENDAVKAATLAEVLGYKEIEVLEGGLSVFRTTILDAQLPQYQLASGDEDTYRFRLKASSQLTALIEARDEPEQVEVRVKKIRGGCGL